MSAPKMPPDNSMQLEQMRQAEARRIKEEEAVKAEKRKQELAGLRTSAGSTGRQSAQQYFQGRGVDPGAYSSDIDALINQTMGQIGPEEVNPGQYFSNIGETAWNRALEGTRNKATRDIDKLFAPNFETTRIPYTLDDPYLASIESEGRSAADQLIRNMLDRRVITQSGYNAAMGDLDKQAPGVRSRLNEIGTTTLAEGQGKLKDIAGRGRQTASTLDLGVPFDPYSFGGEADQAFNQFIASLGDTIRGKAPKNLFDTTGLSAIAGAATGAQNLPFDPNAQEPKTEDEEEEAATPQSVF